MNEHNPSDASMARVIAMLDRHWGLPSSANEQFMLGKYEIIHAIGEGTFGLVFLARETACGRYVALKIPRPEAYLDEDRWLRFVREAEVSAHLNHPGIVRVLETNVHSGTPFIVTEYHAGMNLAEWIAQSNQLPSWKEAVQFVIKIAHALEYAHNQGVIHRDLKPANVILVANAENSPGDLSDFSPRVTDFGLARASELWGDETHSSVILGTPLYMAPEQLCAVGRGTEQSDIYSLGVIFFELLTGQVPINGKTYVELIDRIRSSPSQRIEDFRDDVPTFIRQICRKCLEKSPGGRYRSAGELAEDLELCLNGQHPKRHKPSQIGRFGDWCTHPDRIQDAGQFMITSQVILSLWTVLAFLGAISLGVIPETKVLSTALGVAFVLATLSVPMITVGYLTQKLKAWALFASLIAPLCGLPVIALGMTNQNVVFTEIYQGNFLFSFVTHLMILLVYIFQLWLSACAIAARRSDRA